jgi:hypothetical protein
MEGYKSVEVAFFKKGKLIYLGKPKTPKIVKFLSRGKKGCEAVVGRGLEYISLTMFILSVVYLINI